MSKIDLRLLPHKLIANSNVPASDQDKSIANTNVPTPHKPIVKPPRPPRIMVPPHRALRPRRRS